MSSPAPFPQRDWEFLFLQLMNDLQFFAGRPEEAEFIQDELQTIHHRREWVEERERYEADRRR